MKMLQGQSLGAFFVSLLPAVMRGEEERVGYGYKTDRNGIAGGGKTGGCKKQNL